ncbi:MAG TPA: hypothetical protein VFQ06_12085 [Nitrospira sp.]|nr:hypothetical protein [Nitrospira sp.]
MNWEIFLGTLFLQLGVEVVRQLAFAMPVAFAWEFERSIAWWTFDRRMESVALLITGLAAGIISVVMWPHTFTDQRPFFELATITSPLLTAFLMYRTGSLLRDLGQEPPVLLNIRSATIVAIGMSLTRIAMLSGTGV